MDSGVRILGVMDEADVFVQARSIDGHQNTRISVFLRKLEYNQGIMFLTINRVRDFDDAIWSKITLAVSQRSGIYNPEDLEGLARKDLNGRQINNMVAAAHALAMYHSTKVSMSHLELVTSLSEGFDSDFGGADQAFNKHSYLKLLLS